MSKTKPVVCGHQGFWGYDVAVGIFLKYLIDAANASPEAGNAWLSEETSSWRVQAVVGDFQLTLGESWTAEQRATFIRLAKEACAGLAARPFIPAEEIVSWRLDPKLRMETRGAQKVLTGPVVELGRAMIELVEGTLPEPPKGEAFCFGWPGGRTTLQMNPSWNGRWDD